MTITFSVVIPAYNAEKTIRRCVDSVLCQEFLPIEIIIIDDCSTDATQQIIGELSQSNQTISIRIAELKINSGPSAARNLGVKLATGSHIAFLDADDFWLSFHLANVHRILIGTDPISVVSGIPLVAGLDGNYQEDELPKSSEFMHKQLSLGRMIFFQQGYCTPATVVPKMLFEHVGGFPSDSRYAEDFEFFLMLRKNVRYFFSIQMPYSVVVSKHLWASGRGLSSFHFKMYLGTLRAISRVLDRRWRIFQLTVFSIWHTIKYIRRLLFLLYCQVMRFRIS